MKILQRRSTALIVLLAAIVLGILIGQTKRPPVYEQNEEGIPLEFSYVYDYADILSAETERYITRMNNGLVSLTCLLYTSPSPRDYAASRMPSSA